VAKQSDSFGDGVPFVVWVVLWALAPAATIALYGHDAIEQISSTMIGRDFTNLWVAGKLVLSGQASCAFDVDCFRSAMAQDLGLVARQNYSYPPHALFLAAPFALLPYMPALVVWTVTGIIFFSLCARPYLPGGFPIYLAAFTSAGWLNIWAGHYGFFFGGLWLLFFTLIEKHPGSAGAVAAILTFKPHLGLMIAATAIRKRQVFACALIGVAVVVGTSAIAFGPATWTSFLVDTAGMQGKILTTPAPEGYFRLMPSAYVAFGRGAFGAAMQVLFALAAVWMLWRNRGWDAFSAATATFLLLPYAFNYDMTVVCLGIAICLYRNWSRLSPFERAGLFLAFLSPQLTLYAPPVVPMILAYALAIQLRAGARPDVSRDRSGPAAHIPAPTSPG
jgi:hypothetical protein